MSEARQTLRVLCPKRLDLAPHFDRAAQRYRIDAALLVSVAKKESECRPGAVSKGGKDIGVMQVRMGTLAARGRTVDELMKPAVNIMLAARHLARCLLLCGDWAGGLSVYSGRRRCVASRYSEKVIRLMSGAAR